jgi:8-oxo-dGTP pyrophosphatase MutT (NUDIX family)
MSDVAVLERLLKQVAALPWRLTPDGAVEVLLVTSRISAHWLLPKGWPMAGKSNAQAAQVEAFEEAGIEGRISKSRLGKFHYRRIEPDGSTSPCVVSVFPLAVMRELRDWPEQHQRQRRWFTLEEAAEAVFVPGLAEFLSRVAVSKESLVLRRPKRVKGGHVDAPAIGSNRSDD